MLKTSKLILLLCLFNFHHAGGQYSRTMYFMNVPQARFLNPAIKPPDSLYIGFPLISGAGIGIDNNFLKYEDLNGDESGSNGVSSGLMNRKPDEIKRNNSLQSDIIIQLFSIAFKAFNGFIFIDINERAGLSGGVSREVLRYASTERVYIGESHDFSGIDMALHYIREAGFGYSRSLKSGVRAGVKAKFLMGMGSAQTDISRFDFIVDRDRRFVDADIDLDVSAPLDIKMENGFPEDIDIDRQRARETVLMQNGLNPGFSVDLGVIWPATEKISLSASVTDLGFIRWRNDYTTFNVNEEFDYRNFRIRDPGGNNSFEDIENRILDSLRNILSVNVFHKPYTGWLPATLYAAAEYDLSRHVSLGVVSRSRFFRGAMHQSLTFSTNINLNNYLSASIGYTLANRRYDNLGAGVAFSAGPVQLYLVSDRIPFYWRNVSVSDSNMRVPVNPNTIDFRGGINLFFGGRNDRSGCVFPYRNDIRIRKRTKRL